MRKLTKVIIFQIIILSLLGFAVANADFNVTIGTIYSYDIVESQWSIIDGNNSGGGTKLNVGGNEYATGTQFTIEVIDATTTYVDWEIAIGGTTAQNTDIGSGGPVSELLYLPTVLNFGLGFWDQEEVDIGPPLLFEAFFVEPTLVGGVLQNLHDYATGQTPPSYWTYNEINANFDDSGSIAVFDWVYNTMYNDSGCNNLFYGDYYCKLAYEKATGSVMGYKIAMNYEGHSGGDNLNIEIKQIIEQVGYDLGSNMFNPNEQVGYNWLLTIPALVTISAIVLIRKRNK